MMENLSPLDGRYRANLDALRQHMSEAALIRFRVAVECEYLIFLLETVRPSMLGERKKAAVRNIAKVSPRDILTVKKIETRGHEKIPATNHDVKAAEYFLRLKFKRAGLSALSPFLHFALTSEDVSNISYALMLSLSLKKVLLPEISRIRKKMSSLAVRHKSDILLARTHGQSAVPTTFGKEFRVFAARVGEISETLKDMKIPAKINGAVGNYNAHVCAYPKVNWPEFSENFISRLAAKFGANLRCNKFTTQIEPHDGYARLFDLIKLANSVLTDFCQDAWRYISDGLMVQKAPKSEVGSSTMPHKINPINFENAEGNLGVANALFAHFSAKLPVSRLQRDLSDSTVKRNFAVAFGHSYLGYLQILEGLGKICVNREKGRRMVGEHPEIYGEAAQTILRREGVADAYETMKNFLKGEKTDEKSLLAFINSLKIGEKAKAEIRRAIQSGYKGLAEELALMENY